KFIAVKEASGDLYQAMQIIKNRPTHLKVLSGEDPLTLAMIACGGDGVISVIANAYPKTFSEMVRASLHGHFAQAQQLNEQLLDLHPPLYKECNPAGIKAVMEILGFCSKDVRLPLAPASAALTEELKALVRRVQEKQGALH
ncbi:MAG: dihydrodipicolinate synthase family protein, partial [Bacteroidota bacterium]